MQKVNNENRSEIDSKLLDHIEISSQYFYPQYALFDNPFFIQSGDNKLACYYHKVDNPQKTIVHFHGNGEVVANYQDSTLQHQFERMGCSVLFVEYRGYGLSKGGSPSLVAMLDDVEKIIETIDVPMEEIVLFGRSVGSIYALHGAFCFPNISGLIIESGISDVVARVINRIDPQDINTTKEQLKKEGTLYFNHQKKIETYQGKILILHTKHDSLVSSSNAINLYEWADEPKKLKLFDEGDHNNIMYANLKEYFELIKLFIKGL